MIKVLLVDDEALVRSGLRLILEASGDITIVAEARDGDEALLAINRHRPDVVLMDVRMPGRDGLSALRELQERADTAKVIMLTTFDIDDYVHEALRAGAVGFLLKDTPPRDLAEAVRVVAAGNAMLSPTVTRRLIKAFAGRGASAAELARDRLRALTDRELEVVCAVGRGLSNNEIGRELDMAEATVKAHVSRALAKLGATNRVQAAMLVHDAGLV
jgi:DNA-binding NarL/FixJ family response regulator